MNDPIHPAHAQELVSMGNCLLHYHDADRVMDHGKLIEFQGVARTSTKTGDYTLTDGDDFILVDTTAANVTVSLPRALNGREYEVMKNAAPHVLTIVPFGAELILGSTGVLIYNYGTSLRFKAVNGGWIII